MNTGFQPILSMNVVIVVVILRILVVVVDMVIVIVTVIRMIVGCGFTVRFVDNNHRGTVNVRNVRRLGRGGTFRAFPRRVSIFHETRSLGWRRPRRAIGFASLRALGSL